MLTLIQHGQVYAPEPRGIRSILVTGSTIHAVGAIDPHALSTIEPACQLLDATDCVVLPGLIDPHEHLIGAGGEQGPGSRMPEVAFQELALSCITTVIGCLGTDTTTRPLKALLGKTRELEAGGLTACMYTGGFPVPPCTLSGSVTDDLVLIDRVIGVGEVAINDVRSSEPALQELARMVSDAIIGGMVGGKAGVTHFHVGSGRRGLQILRELLDEHEIAPEYVYPTHINRTDSLLLEGIGLARRGCFVDMDTVDGDFPRWLGAYRENGGPLDRLTVSSDAHTPGGSPAKLFAAFRAAAHSGQLPLDELLPLFTSNAAAALHLAQKGRLEAGLDADIVVLRRETLDLVHLMARGRLLVRDGAFVDAAVSSP